MNTSKERILVVESDLEVSDLIVRQTLAPLGYRVQLVGSAALAIQEAARFVPDVIIVNLNLPGLSGKDMLVGLSAQGIDVPIIVLAEKGLESDVIQAFRLGAADFINTPLREAEVVSAVERVLKQTRARREREQLSRQLNQTNQELQRRVRELTTIFSIGKAVISITDQRVLFDKIVEGAVFITEADLGWLLLKEDRSKAYVLRAHQNLPVSLNSRLNQPWDDGISSLVALSGESLSIHGDPLKRFKVAQLGQSALVVPLKVKNEVVGLLVVVRKKPLAFNASSQALLEAVADYASISLVNARLFRALEERVHTFQLATETAQLGEQVAQEILNQVCEELKDPLLIMKGNLDLLSGKANTNLASEQVNALSVVKDQLQSMTILSEAAREIQPAAKNHARIIMNLNEAVHQTVARIQPLAQRYGILINLELPQKPIQVIASPFFIERAFEGLWAHSLGYGSTSGQRTIHMEPANGGQVQVQLFDKEALVDEKQFPRFFEKNFQMAAANSRFAGLRIGLPLVKEIISAHSGKVWVSGKPGEGITYHIMLPLVRG
jgi:DNA-binding response OmpR family regulator/signal transduction histidine kinase